MRRTLQFLFGCLAMVTLLVPDASANVFGMVDAESERSGNFRFISFMNVATTRYDGVHFREIDGYLTAGHVIPEEIPELKMGNTATKMIVDLSSWVFENGEPSPRIDEYLKRVKEDYVGVNLSKVLAFLIKDEPFLIKDSSTNKKALEKIITHVNKHFDGVPTYISFARYCFDPTWNYRKENGELLCIDSNLRGIPDNLDWVGFNFYTNLQGDLNGLSALFKRDIIGGVERIKKKCVKKVDGKCEKEQGLANKPIVLSGEAFNALHIPNPVRDPKEARKRILQLVDLYLDYARHERSVIGVNFFTWKSFKSQKEHINGINFDSVIKNKLLNEGLKVTCGWKINAGIDSEICRDSRTYVPQGPFRILKSNYIEGEERSVSFWQGYYRYGDIFCDIGGEGNWNKVVGVPISDWEWRLTTLAQGLQAGVDIPIPTGSSLPLCNLNDIGITPGAFKTKKGFGYISTGKEVCSWQKSQADFEKLIGFPIVHFEREIREIPSHVKSLGACSKKALKNIP